MAKKFWGQHFLKDKKLLQRIIEGLKPSLEDVVLEIGPGQGALTGELINQVKKLIVVEIDRDLCGYLGEKFADRKNLEIIAEDFLKLNLEEIMKKEKICHLKILGNLPYYITSPILRKLTEEICWDLAVVTIQKEVAERVIADPGTKKYGLLSLAIQNKCQTEYLFSIPKTHFFPIPKVDSAVIKLLPRTKPLVPKNWEKQFFQVVHAAFGQRRKTLSNSLSHGLNLEKEKINKTLESCGISTSERAEKLSSDDFLNITKNICFPDTILPIKLPN
ncbi:MAG: 16S rRNA (adenine(1518)-N(6)/adenine(1519)-N(6))-dimethyltransferase RsmA [Elusimicrobiota bacterium]